MSRRLEVGNRPPAEVMAKPDGVTTERDPRIHVQTVEEVRKSKGFGWDYGEDFLG